MPVSWGCLTFTYTHTEATPVKKVKKRDRVLEPPSSHIHTYINQLIPRTLKKKMLTYTYARPLP